MTDRRVARTAEDVASSGPAAPKRAAGDTLRFTRKADWAAWLAQHHASSRGVGLLIAKKGSTSATVTYDEAVEVALAWGWIDGKKEAHDGEAWIQRFSPRTARSPWSKINRDRAQALIAAGAMAAPGLAEVERAQRDGRWEAAYDSSRTSSMPSDLAAALESNARAKAFFETLDRANRYAILWRVQTAKKPETRAERIARFVAMLARHEKIHEPRKRAPKNAGDGVSEPARAPARSRARARRPA